jgi:hypothetical protein
LRARGGHYLVSALSRLAYLVGLLRDNSWRRADPAAGAVLPFETGQHRRFCYSHKSCASPLDQHCRGNGGKEVAKVSLTLEQASDLIIQLKAALADHAQFLDIVMPNGKRIGDCSGQYVRDVGEALYCLDLETA